MVLLIFNLVVNDNHSGNCVLHGACSSNVVEDQAILLLKEGAKELGSRGKQISHIRPQDSVFFLCGTDWQKGHQELGVLQEKGRRQCQWNQCWVAVCLSILCVLDTHTISLCQAL